ncbi:MAG: hypothetical protein QM737_15805 [Ferruginibacter sp.]
MEAKSTDKKIFKLIEKEKLLGEIIYENLFHLKAILQLPGTQHSTDDNKHQSVIFCSKKLIRDHLPIRIIRLPIPACRQQASYR